VAIAGCGVCHTGLGYYYDGLRTNQRLPLALGHEISGRVVAAGAGAALALNVREHDAKALKKTVADIARQRGLRATEWKIFECSGTGAGQTSAFNLLVHGATPAVVGFTMDKVELRPSNLVACDAPAIGNWGCPPEFYPAALDLMLDGKVRLAPYVGTHPLTEINAVFHAVHACEITRRAVMVP
jgi:6-hydroxycyclohex-1-ene-1-carbonyl-CoA dehydrogenase